jgi:hypothetical protein
MRIGAPGGRGFVRDSRRQMSLSLSASKIRRVSMFVSLGAIPDAGLRLVADPSHTLTYGDEP